jgi:hypothetical protein
MSSWQRVLAQVAIALSAAGSAGTAFALAAPNAAAPSAALPSAAEIVQRNLAARGGAEAWAKTLTMVWSGHVESTGPRAMKTPFVLQQMRPDRTRFEVASQGQTAVRIYDGSNGWKVIPNATGRPEMQPYSEDELRFARGAQAIEGPLMNYAARHAAIEFLAVGDLDGRKAYVLEVKLPDGGAHRVWVDAQTFLELRHDRSVRNASGQPGTVTVFFRDYRSFEGLQLPTTIETRSANGQASNRLVIEKVAINPPLEMHAFAKPETPGSRHRGVVVDTRSAARAALPQ